MYECSSMMLFAGLCIRKKAAFKICCELMANRRTVSCFPNQTSSPGQGSWPRDMILYAFKAWVCEIRSALFEGSVGF